MRLQPILTLALAGGFLAVTGCKTIYTDVYQPKRVKYTRYEPIKPADETPTILPEASATDTALPAAAPALPTDPFAGAVPAPAADPAAAPAVVDPLAPAAAPAADPAMMQPAQ